MPVLELVSPSARRRGTWAGGVTEELARWGDDPRRPRARLSVATIERAAAFSPLPGRRRWLAVLDDGGGLTLTTAAGRRALVTGDHLAFDGGEPVFAEPGPRPARIWNAIVADPAVALDAAIATTPLARRFEPGVIAIHAVGALEIDLGGTRPCLAADHALLAASSTPVTVAITAAAPTLVVWAWLGLAPVGLRSVDVRPAAVTVTIQGAALLDWPGFHAAMARAFGFRPTYGANFDAWLDCLTDLDEPAAGMTAVHVAPGGVVTLIVDDVDVLAARAPAIFAALVDGVALINQRRLERGAPAVLALAYARRHG